MGTAESKTFGFYRPWLSTILHDDAVNPIAKLVATYLAHLEGKGVAETTVKELSRRSKLSVASVSRAINQTLVPQGYLLRDRTLGYTRFTLTLNGKPGDGHGNFGPPPVGSSPVVADITPPLDGPAPAARPKGNRQRDHEKYERALTATHDEATAIVEERLPAVPDPEALRQHLWAYIRRCPAAGPAAAANDFLKWHTDPEALAA